MLKKIGLGLAVASVSGAASAAGTAVDLTSLTTAVDFSTTSAAILSTAGVLITVYITWKAARMVIAAVKGL